MAGEERERERGPAKSCRPLSPPPGYPLPFPLLRAAAMKPECMNERPRRRFPLLIAKKNAIPLGSFLPPSNEESTHLAGAASGRFFGTLIFETTSRQRTTEAEKRTRPPTDRGSVRASERRNQRANERSGVRAGGRARVELNPRARAKARPSGAHGVKGKRLAPLLLFSLAMFHRRVPKSPMQSPAPSSFSPRPFLSVFPCSSLPFFLAGLFVGEKEDEGKVVRPFDRQVM